MTNQTAFVAHIGLTGLGVMGQNLALNIAEKGFPIAVHNRSIQKTQITEAKAKSQGIDATLKGYENIDQFVKAIKKPRAVIILVTAGKAVDETIKQLAENMESGDIIIDGGNEWYENTERRQKEMEKKGILYMGMGVSGGEEGARHGPSLMPGGPKDAYERVKTILEKVAAQVNDGPCVTYIGPRGAGNYVKMVHNGIEYGDMQLIAESYDLLKNVGGLNNEELHAAYDSMNKAELESYLIDITAKIFAFKDNGEYTVDKIRDKTGSKGTGKWTVQTAAEFGVPAPTIFSALDMRYMSSLKDERVKASKILHGPVEADHSPQIGKEQLVTEVARALYAAKICSYAQGLNIIKTAAKHNEWNVNLGEIARIWKGGCIIRAKFLDRIKKAYDREPNLDNLLIDPEFAAEMNDRQKSLRKVVILATQVGVGVPAFAASLAYFDSYRKERLPANLTQAQRDFFGAHTYERLDSKPGEAFHTEWSRL